MSRCKSVILQYQKLHQGIQKIVLKGISTGNYCLAPGDQGSLTVLQSILGHHQWVVPMSTSRGFQGLFVAPGVSRKTSHKNIQGSMCNLKVKQHFVHFFVLKLCYIF